MFDDIDRIRFLLRGHSFSNNIVINDSKCRD